MRTFLIAALPACYGSDPNESANAATFTSDGGFVVAGRYHKLISDGRTTRNMPHRVGDDVIWIDEPYTDTKYDTDIRVVRLKIRSIQKNLFTFRQAACIFQTMNRVFIISAAIMLALGVARLHGQNPVWTLMLGGTGSDWPSDVHQTTDGGFIVAGTVGMPDGDVAPGKWHLNDGWVVKLAPEGQIQWQWRLGMSGTDYISCVEQTADGGYIVAGMLMVEGDQSTAGVVAKLSADGVLVWQKNFGHVRPGPGSYEQFSKVRQTPDGGYIVVGSKSGIATGYDPADPTGQRHTPADCWVVKLTSAGDIQWVWRFDDEYHGYEGATDVWPTRDGGYLVASDIAMVFKLNRDGATEWQYYYGSRSDELAIQVIRQVSDGNFVFAGYEGGSRRKVNGERRDFWIVKTTDLGKVMWERHYGGSGIDGATSMEETPDSGLYVAGYTSSRDGDVGCLPGWKPGRNPENNRYWGYWLIKLDAEGKLRWKNNLGDFQTSGPICVTATMEGGCIVATGRPNPEHKQSSDFWLGRFSAPLRR